MLSNRNSSSNEMAELLWRLLMRGLDSSVEVDQQLLKTRIVGAADLHLQYMQELEAEHSSIAGASAEPFIAVLAELPPLLCTASFNYSSQTTGRPLYDAELLLSSGILNAAMLQLAGLGKYLHTLHVSKQSPGLERSEQGPGGGASSSSSPRTSSRRPAKVKGASSFAQLQLPADHEGVRVVGGARAVAAVSKRWEWKENVLGIRERDFLRSWDLSVAMHLLRLAVACRLRGGQQQ